MVNLPPSTSSGKALPLHERLSRLLPDREAILAMLGALQNLLFSFEGRIRRLPFWLGVSGILAAALVLERWVAAIVPAHGPLASVMVGSLAIYPLGALATKRGIDRGHGETWGVTLLLLIVAEGALAGYIGHGPFAALASFCALGLWMFALADLGILPAPDEAETVGEAGPR